MTRRSVALLVALVAFGGSLGVSACSGDSETDGQSLEQQMEDSQQEQDAIQDFDMDGVPD